MKKLYYLADVLTLCEVIAGLIILAMSFLQVPADIVIWIFVFGELCDAFDGPCARRWKYPNDGKSRWWRTYVKQIEHLSDIFIAVSCMIYLMSLPTDITYRLPQFITPDPVSVALSASILGMIIIGFCASAEFAISGAKTAPYDRYNKPIILIRRWIYAFLGIGGGVFLLIMATSWPDKVKWGIVGLGIIIGLLLLYFKRDRATGI